MAELLRLIASPPNPPSAEAAEAAEEVTELVRGRRVVRPSTEEATREGHVKCVNYHVKCVKCVSHKVLQDRTMVVYYELWNSMLV